MIHHGDALTVLRTLPSESVHCCVTSPPYWGLRDYGTATWEGGAADCDHLMLRGSQGHSGERADRGHTQRVPYKEVCSRCGGLRVDKQLGLEKTPEEFVQKATDIFREVRRVLRDDGTLWVNIGDSYAAGGNGGHVKGEYFHGHTRRGGDFSGEPKKAPPGLKPKDLVGIPWMLAFALRADGWYLRSEIIWHKPNPMPESVKDRPTKAHEQIFLLAKSESYYYDAEAISEPVTGGSHARGNGVNPKALKWPNAWSAEEGRHDGVGNGRFKPKQNESFSAAVKDLVDSRNKRTVWTVPTQPFPEAHFATFPEKLIEPCILAGCPKGGTVLDPFAGSGTTGVVAARLGCEFIGIELSAEYIEIANRRNAQRTLNLDAAAEESFQYQ